MSESRALRTERASPAAAFFGKLPGKRDFVRIRHDHPASIALDEWLTGSAARCAEQGGRLKPPDTRFWFAHPDLSLAGVLSASADRAGRAFPAAIYAPVDTAALSRDPASICLASEKFQDDATALLHRFVGDERPGFDAFRPALDGMRLRLRAAPEAVFESLDGEPLAGLFERLQLQPEVALGSLFEAVEDHPKGPRRPALVLSAPAPDLTAVLFWLRCLSGLLRWPATSAFNTFWVQGERLLCVLGPPSEALLGCVGGADAGAIRGVRNLGGAGAQPGEAHLQQARQVLAALPSDATAAAACAHLASRR